MLQSACDLFIYNPIKLKKVKVRKIHVLYRYLLLQKQHDIHANLTTTDMAEYKMFIMNHHYSRLTLHGV